MPENEIEIDEKKRFWIDIELESAENQRQLKNAFEQAQKLRKWTIAEMMRSWSAVSGAVKVAALMGPVTEWMHQERIVLQHYTVVSVLNETVAAFNQRVRVEVDSVNDKVAVIYVEDPLAGKEALDYDLVIQSRSTWPRYIKNYGRISTVFGPLYLVNDWEEVLVEQRDKVDAPHELFGYLIYSAVIRRHNEEWQLHFNLHNPRSHHGRSRKASGRKALKIHRE